MIIQPYMPHHANGVESERRLEEMLTALPQDADAFQRSCRAVDDWTAVFATASLHGVEEFLFRQLPKETSILPQRIRQDLEARRLCKAAWMLHLNALLDRASDALAAAGVRSVAIKGPMLGERLYGDSALRSSTDLDILIAYGDLPRALEAFASIGYAADEKTVADALRGDHNVALIGPTPPVIEAHFHLFRRFGATLSSDDFMSRAVSYRSKRGRQVNVLSPEDEFLFLCVHLAAHHFIRLAWLFDLKLYLVRHADFDWNALMARARRLKLVSAVAFTCEILRQRLGVKTPMLEMLTARQRMRLSINNYLFDRTMRMHNAPREAFRKKVSFLVTSNAYSATLHDGVGAALTYLGNNFWNVLSGRRPDPGDA
jgi:hypothetical protein